MKISVFARRQASEPDERTLVELAQEEAEAIAQADLPPDPGLWWTHLTDQT